MRNIATACALLAFLLLAGCSGGKEEDVAATAGGTSARGIHVGTEGPREGRALSRPPAHTAATKRGLPQTVAPPRKEFVVMRELVRQHELQQGNDKRLEAVEKALKEKFPVLPDKGETDEERQIYRDAENFFRERR